MNASKQRNFIFGYEEFPLSSKRFRKILKQLMENLNDLIPSGGCPEVL